MNEKLKVYLKDLLKASDITSKELVEIQNQLGFHFPGDYVDLILEINGAEGEIGEESWLSLFSLDELLIVNKSYDFLMEQIPDYFLFGKDAADTGYGFHKVRHSYHSFGLMSDFSVDPINFCGNNLEEFIEYLYNR